MNTKTETTEADGRVKTVAASPSVLLVTTMGGAANCAAVLERQLKLGVQIAGSRREAISELRKHDFAVVVMEEGMAGADPRAADSIWQQAGGALLMQVNFAISGTDRLVREVRAALARSAQQQVVARRAAAVAVESELNSTVTGIMLESELALREPEMPPTLEAKLRHLVELAASLRQKLQATAENPANIGNRK